MAHLATSSPLKYFAASVNDWQGGHVILHVTPKWLDARKLPNPSPYQVYPVEEDAPALGFQTDSEYIPRHVEIPIPQIIIEETAQEQFVSVEDKEIRLRDIKRKHSQDEDATITTSNQIVNTQDPSTRLCDIQNPNIVVRVTQEFTEIPTNKYIPTTEKFEKQIELITAIQNSSKIETQAEVLSNIPFNYQEEPETELEVLTTIALEALDRSYQKSSNSLDFEAREVDRLSIVSTTLENDRGSDSGRESAQAEECAKVDFRNKKGSVLLDVSNLSIKTNTDSGIFVEDRKGDISKIPKDQLPTSSLLSIFLQIFIPYLLAGVGTCATGLLLDKVQHWQVFKEIPQLIILVPPLLGLKGNLEMTLASRLSTQANLGNLKTQKQQWKASWGNTAAITCQAVVVGLLAAVFAVAMGMVQRSMGLEQVLVLTAGCLATAVLASFLLAIVTILVVIYAPRLGIDPDNVATPVAASLGDLTTLAVLAYSSHFLHTVPGYLVKLSACGAVLGVCILLVPLLLLLALKNRFSRQVLKTGWIPVVASVVITSGGGAVLERSVGAFGGLALFQPVINGLGGNLVAVHASRTSTELHQGGFVAAKFCLSPCQVFFSKSVQSTISRMLLLMVLPGHAIFAYSLHALRGYTTALTNPFFLPIYLGAAFIQVLVLLYVGSVLVRLLWRMGADPDNSAIPLLTALGDLLGSLLLALAFYCYSLL